MHITFSNYFSAFSSWQYQIYWIAGDGDGLIDIETRIRMLVDNDGAAIKRIQLNSAKDFSLIKESLNSNDLFDVGEILYISCAKSQMDNLLNACQNFIDLNKKIIIFSPKLTPTLKKHATLQHARLGCYSIYPLSTQQISQWWATACKSLKIELRSDVTKKVLIQSGFRIDRLKSYLDKWQLLYPEGGLIEDVEDQQAEPGQHHYQWAGAWLKGLDVNAFVSNERHYEKYFFALRYTIDELLTMDFYLKIGVSRGELSKKMRWWPQKAREMSEIYHAMNSKDLNHLGEQIINVDLARVGYLPYDFSQLFKIYFIDKKNIQL